MKQADKNKMKAVLPVMGVGMAAGAALLMMARPRKKPSVQQAAGKALHAMGDAVERFPGSLKM